MAWETLPTELWLSICYYLSVEDILSLRRCSKALFDVTRERGVWFDALNTHIIDKNIPVYRIKDKNAFSLSSAELEGAILHALKVRANWTSSNPCASRHTDLRTTPPDSRRYARTYASYFIPGTDSRYLLTLTRLELTPREYIIQCWDLHRPNDSYIARYISHNLRGVQINSEPNHLVTLAITCNHVSNQGMVTLACGINYSARDSDNAFQIHNVFETLGTALKLEGSTFFATDESNRITAYSVDTGAVLYVLHVPLVHNDQTVFLEEHSCLSIQLLGNFILTFCQQWTHLYALPQDELPAPSGDAHVPALDPIASHRWPYRIDTLKTVAMHAHPLAGARTPYPPIHILLRFDSWYPWPVNILHLFVLAPNLAFALGASGPQRGAEPPYLHAGGAPYVAAAVPSALRIFTPADMLLGRHGTALWLDAQTGAPSQAGDRGQRIAGAVLRAGPPPTRTHAQPRHAVNLDVQGNDGGEGGAGPASVRASLFHLQEDAEEWTRLALSDDEGIMAISCMEGKVMVYDYT